VRDDLHGLTKQLLALIRRQALDTSLAELRQHQEKWQARARSAEQFFAVLKDAGRQASQDAEAKGNAGRFILESAVSRLAANLARSGWERDFETLRAVWKKRLEECRLACAILAAGSGNGGRAWKDVEICFPQNRRHELDVRCGTLTVSAAALEKAAPDLDWKFDVPAILPFERSQAVCVAGPEFTRETVGAAIESVVLRLLLSVAPGQLRVVFLNPGGELPATAKWLPDSVLADGPAQIESALDALIHRTDDTIASYNRQSVKNGNAINTALEKLAEPSWILVSLDSARLPSKAIPKLRALIRDGRRRGVISLLQWVGVGNQYDQKRMREVASGCSIIAWNDDRGVFVWQAEGFEDYVLNHSCPN
jgi:hypothetical protein